MRSLSLLLMSGALMLAGAIEPARAQQPATPSVYAATYFDVSPDGARKAAGMLRQFAAATRKEDGNAELTVLHEAGRPGRFAIVEGWRDKAAFEAHGAAMKALGGRLQPLVLSPFDARPFVPLSVTGPVTGPVAAPAGAATAGAVYVLTHVDVFPAGKDEVAAMVKQLAEDSRREVGALRFDALVWDGHPNHFHLIEAWSDRKAREAHAAADHTKAFRAKLVPFEGAFYDERLYQVVK
ncbi:MAG TPA: antibiotic biosynthesis monooxygenase [Stellaceae bacterium]|nr:antibiotic biosynthesis monooxygenase [Stellaceae bacterium]